MSIPLNPPFRAEHIGSFLRPPELIAARAAFEAGKLDAAALRKLEDEAIRGVVRLQEEIGLKVVTDGEYRRDSYSDNFTNNGLAGVEAEWVGDGDWTYHDVSGGTKKARVPMVKDRIRWDNSRNVEDFKFVASVAKAMPKMTLPGPAYIHYRSGRANISKDVYPDLDLFWSDLVAAYHVEFKKLAEAGCRYVQLDETSLAKLGDPKIRNALARRGDDWEKLLDVYLDAINAVVDGAPAGMRIGMHLCRGNNQGHWQAEGGYDVIAEKLFKKAKIAFYFLEYDSPRAGGFEPLRQLPADKVVVLGLISTKVAELEPAELLRKRLAEAFTYAPKEQLAISPQCGFASAHQGNKLSVEQQIAKLKRVIEMAQETWGNA
jgi:5-methyltetrahydropteroyltriglutamate--homocysteine methyltransferase